MGAPPKVINRLAWLYQIHLAFGVVNTRGGKYWRAVTSINHVEAASEPNVEFGLIFHDPVGILPTAFRILLYCLMP